MLLIATQFVGWMIYTILFYPLNYCSKFRYHVFYSEETECQTREVVCLWTRTVSLVNRLLRSSALVTKSTAAFGINSDSFYLCIINQAYYRNTVLIFGRPCSSWTI